MFFVDGLSAEDAAEKFGYTRNALYSLVRDFKSRLISNKDEDMFFIERNAGRKPKDADGTVENLILSLRKKYLSVPDIKAVLDVQQIKVSERYVYNVIL